jgi:hypothetical protein
MQNKNNVSKKLTWEISVPIFRNPFILKQLGIAIGLPFSLLIIVLILISQEIRYLSYALGLIALLFLFTYIVIMLLYRGTYDVGFVLDQRGLRCYTQKKQARKNKFINGLSMIIGIFFRKPGVAGAGMLAQSRQDIRINWRSIRNVRFRPKQQLILVKGNFAENIAVFCNNENYDQVTSFINQHTKS